MIRKLSHTEIVALQSENLPESRISLRVVLNNIRSLHNVGSMFRSADGAHLEHIYCCGITGYPPMNQLRKTALGADDVVPWSYHSDALSVVRDARSEGYAVTVVEQTDTGRPYQTYDPPDKLCLIFGNEVEGVDSAIVELSDDAIEITMDGFKNSLNVAVAFGIVVFDIRNKMRASLSGGC